jgi:hypothetical protein
MLVSYHSVVVLYIHTINISKLRLHSRNQRCHTVGTMRESQIQSLKLQLEEALQMLRLVAAQERTCMEVQEWLDANHPEADDQRSSGIMDLLSKSSHDDGR